MVQYIDTEQQKTFIRNLYVGMTDYVEIRFLPSGKQLFFKVDEFEGVEGSENIYFGVSQRFQKRGDADSCSLTPAAWLDFDKLDSSDPDTRKDEVLVRIKNAGLPDPSVIVSSGNGIHVYWLLDQPAGDELVPVLKGMAKMTNADPRPAEKARIMRLPGTPNRKKEPVPCVILESDYNRKYSFDSLNSIVMDYEYFCQSISYRPKRNPKAVSPNSVLEFDCRHNPVSLKKEVNSTAELLSILKKQNMLKLSSEPNYDLGKLFNCPFHADETPSANVFMGKYGDYLFKCHGCGLVYDTVGFYQELKQISFETATIELGELFGIKITRSPFQNEQHKKYLENEKLIHSKDSLVEYPYLRKILKPRLLYLHSVNQFGLQNIKPSPFEYMDESLFCLSYRHLVYGFAKAGTERTCNRNLNLFCALGLMKKVPFDELPPIIQFYAEKHINDHKTLKPTNYYIIFNFNHKLELAEKRAKQLKKSKFKIATMSKESLIISLGQQIANEVYPDDRALSHKNVAIAAKLEKTMQKLIAEHGYATKNEIIAKTYFSKGSNISWQKKRNEFDKFFNLLLEDNNLVCVRANKLLVETFGLTRSVNIIVPKSNHVNK